MTDSKVLLPLDIPLDATELAQQYSHILGEFPFKITMAVCKDLMADGLVESFNYKKTLPSQLSALMMVAYLGITWSAWNSFCYTSSKIRKGRTTLPPRAKYLPKQISGGRYAMGSMYHQSALLLLDDHWHEAFKTKRQRPLLSGIKPQFEQHLRHRIGRYLSAQVNVEWPAGLPTTSDGFHRKYGAHVIQVLKCRCKFRGTSEEFNEMLQDIWRRLLQSNVRHKFAQKYARIKDGSKDPEEVAKCFRGYLKKAVCCHFANWVRDRQRHFNSEFTQTPKADSETSWEDQVTTPFPGSSLGGDYVPEEMIDLVRELNHHGCSLKPSDSGEGVELLLENIRSAVEQGYSVPQAVKAAAKSSSHSEMREKLARIRPRAS